MSYYITDMMNNIKDLIEAGSYAISYSVETNFTNYQELKNLTDTKVVIFPHSATVDRMTRAGDNQHEVRMLAAVLKRVIEKPSTDEFMTEIGGLFEFMLNIVDVLSGQSLECGAVYKNIEIEQFFDYEYLNSNRAFSGVIAVNYMFARGPG